MKIAFIGAGSVGFTRKLCADILAVQEFNEIEICLEDINGSNLDLIYHVLDQDIKANNLSNVKLTKTTEQRKAVEIWGGSCDPSLNLPPVSATPSEVQRQASVSSALETYVDEMSNRFVMGLEPLDNFDQFVNRIKSMNLDEAIALYQAALDRYYKR